MYCVMFIDNRFDRSSIWFCKTFEKTEYDKFIEYFRKTEEWLEDNGYENVDDKSHEVYSGNFLFTRGGDKYTLCVGNLCL